jgi:pseudouridine synthase
LNTGIRLNKLLSSAGIASRRAADELITQGRVSVNGIVVTTLGVRADPEDDDIRVDGRRLKPPPERRYILLNKPSGVVSTRSDPQRRTTVIDLLARAGVRGYFYPVGRLDYDSEGLIILTNDGALAERVTHPRYGLERTYEAQVAGVPDERDLQRLRRGISLDEGRTAPADVRLLRVVQTRQGSQAVLQVTLHEGRNRQVRRMCDAIAHPIERLRRTAIGAITDARLKPGQLRDLRPDEIRGLRRATDRPTAPSRPRRPPRASPSR